MRFQNVGSRFNLIIIVLVLVLVLEIRILWVPKDEYEDEDDEVLALYAWYGTSRKLHWILVVSYERFRALDM